MNVFRKDSGKATLRQQDEDEEPDFTNGNYRKNLWTDGSSVRCYKPKDLYPNAPKPGYIPSWPLELYHPVYVGNFKVLAWDEHVWHKQVSEYFAYKGLLTRMIYFPQLTGDSFVRFQKANRLIDMLVYFTSSADARKAVVCCHHDSYYGHKLNVLSGRKPSYFDKVRTVKLCLPDKNTNFESETFIEKALSEFGKVVYVMKCSVQKAFVEFESKKAMFEVVSKQTSYTPLGIKKILRQRILEPKIIASIKSVIKLDPLFMQMKPAPDILQCLYEGKRPPIDTAWMNHDTPVPSKDARNNNQGTYGNRQALLPTPSTSGQHTKTRVEEEITPSTRDIKQDIQTFFKETKKQNKLRQMKRARVQQKQRQKQLRKKERNDRKASQSNQVRQREESQ
ncbi:uncharacterized protein LOC131432044 [Malaya genurostris]|uniref:uncharacterized protein LOC131432044 n=1 Tax=Malaya genurostris TaxID=325434 RepID=UPI0026F3C3BE|nr:uncharacterized protein LOC131432044 [Malaya genurostris]